jgi:hypothetical protein
MMSGTRKAAFLISLVATVVLCQTAFAQVTLTYWGETPATGYDSYQPSDYAGEALFAGIADNNYDDNLWDYVYTITPTTPSSGPFFFGVLCEFEPNTIWNDDGDWVGQWYASMPMPSGPLMGQTGVYWEWAGGLSNKPVEGVFHFSSQWAPTQAAWSARGIQDTGYSGDGTTWTAVPEPASMAVTGLCLFGVAAWKRRKGLLNDKDA